MRKQQHRKVSTGGETNLFKQASILATLQSFPVPKLIVACHPQRLKCCRYSILNNDKFVYLHEIAFILHLRHRKGSGYSWHLLGSYQPPGNRRRRTVERKGIYKLPAKKWEPALHKSRQRCQEKSTFSAAHSTKSHKALTFPPLLAMPWNDTGKKVPVTTSGESASQLARSWPEEVEPLLPLAGAWFCPCTYGNSIWPIGTWVFYKTQLSDFRQDL